VTSSATLAVVTARSAVIIAIIARRVLFETRVIRFELVILSIADRILEKLERIVAVRTRVPYFWLQSNLLRLSLIHIFIHHILDGALTLNAPQIFDGSGDVTFTTVPSPNCK